MLALIACCSAINAQQLKPLSARLIAAEKSFSGPQGQPDSNLGVFLEEADAGSAAAKRDLGLVYQSYYLNKRPDPVLALQWFEAASVAGDARAPSYVGDFYLNNANGTPNPATARFWYQKGYKADDARATVALAALSCNGTGEKASIAGCGRLLNAATKLQKPGDPKDVRPSLQSALVKVGSAYQSGKGVPRNLSLAASWYAKAAAEGSVPGAVAEARLYVEPQGLPQNLPRATAILNKIVAYMKKQPLDMDDGFEGQDDIAKVYAEIGARYEAQGQRSLAQASTAYTSAAKLGDGAPAIALGVRYLKGDRIPQNLNTAYNMLMVLVGMPFAQSDRFALSFALSDLATLLKASKDPGDQARVEPAEKAAMLERMPVPEADAIAAAPANETPMAERYPNIAAPDSVATQQQFSVEVSLNSIQFDANTQILSGQQDNGKLQITLPDGMTQMPIQVDLIAPGMTFVNGDTNTSTLTLDSTKPNSTPATFHLRAGSAPASGVIMATLSYHQNFIAQLERPIAIVATTSTPAPITDAAPPVITQPAPDTPSTGRADNGPLVEKSVIKPSTPTLGSPAPEHPAAPQPPITTQLPPKPKPAPIVIDPTAKSTDLTITETLVGDTLHYDFDSPGLALPVFGDVPNAAALKVKIQGYYDQLQSESLVLSQGGGVMCTTARAKGAGGDKDPSCADAVQARALAQGIGNELFKLDAPQAFRDVYQELTSNHIRLHTITVITNDPTLPWELMLPQDGTNNFLGLTASIVRENTSAPQLAQSAENAFDGIAVVIPTYDGAKALPAAQVELKAIKTDFPQAKTVEGDAGSVSTLIRSTPQSIIHYSGHGQSIPPAPGSPAALAPQAAIVLEDESMTPATFVAFRDEGAAAHPFYFFNACDLGTADKELNYISGWAPALMQSGASGYLGALYTIGDASAASFATHFYAGLKSNLTGKNSATMADIVTQARQQTYAEANDPTALAYVLYAKPFMKLVASDNH